MKQSIYFRIVAVCLSVLSLFVSVSASAQSRPNAALWQGDTIVVSYTSGRNTYYVAHVPRSGNGVVAVQNTPNENCLWVLSSMVGEPTAANGKENGAVVQAMSLSADKAGEAEKYLYMSANSYGSLYLVSGDQYNQPSNFYTIKKDQAANEFIEGNILVKNGRNNYYMNYNYYFYAASTTRPQTYRIQRWSGVKESTVSPTFLPNNVIFDWAADAAAADRQAIDVTCKVTKRTGEYYYNRSNPEQRIVLQNPTETEADAGSVSFEWEFPWGPDGQQMEFTTPIYNSSTKTYSFRVKPVGPSPVVESGTPEDIFNHIVCTATYGGEQSTGEMMCDRRKYLHRTLQPLEFTVTHPTYTFEISGGSMQLEPFLYVQDGEEWINADGFAEKSAIHPMYYYDLDDDGNKTSGLTSADRYRVVYGDTHSGALHVEISNSTTLPSWLTFDGFTKWGIHFTAEANPGEEARSAMVMIYVRYRHTVLDAGGNTIYEADGTTPKTIQGEFIRQVILRQPGSNAGAAIAFHRKNVPDGKREQAVHENKQVRYYIPGGSDVVELRPAETSFFAYRRWYNYDNGHGIQNSSEANDNTTWASAPSINVTSGRTTTAYNFTPINTNPEHSRGVFAIARSGSTSSGYRILYNDQNEVMPTIRPYANALGGPSGNGVHTIACDLSCYTDYATTESGGNLTSVTEPTLSYRMLFELHPATEIADALAALGNDEYLENYEYTAPTGVDVHLTTSQRFRSYRYHESELGYFYYTNPGARTGLTRIKGGQSGQTITWKRDGSTFTPTYSTNTDNAIVNSRTTGDVVYTLEIGGRRIAKFTVHYMAPTEVGPSAVALLTNQEIADRYQVLKKIDWDDVDTKPGDTDNVISKYHLPWEDATFGFAYQKPTQLQTNRPSNTDLCYYGEYLLVNRWNKTSNYQWMDPKIENHTGKANGYMLFADGTMEPSMVACINTSTQICSGQQMYCSAWIANACPSGYGTGANPIFRFNVQGRNADNEEWQDVEVFFAGELPKGSGWRQIKFPVSSHHSYEQTRVCVYNFATTNSGNDFFLDDICLFATPLPISAYQAASACSGSDVVVIVKVDYQNVADDIVNKDVYYQGWVRIKPKESDSVTVAIPDLSDFGGYYMWHNDHPSSPTCSYSIQSKDERDNPDKVTAGTAVQDMGMIHIPAKKFVPAPGDVYLSVQTFIDHLHGLDPATRQARSGVFYIQGADGKYSMYLAHLLRARDGGHYEVRFAEDPAELPSPLCAMSVQLPIYKQTKLTWGENDREIVTPELNVCPNVNDEIKVTVTNANIADDSHSGKVTTANGRADWLIGIAADTIYGSAYNDPESHISIKPVAGLSRRAELLQYWKDSADRAFLKYYGYTREQVTTAFVYDLRRMPYLNAPNLNYEVSDYTQLNRAAFLNEQNYDIVYNLCHRGLVDLNVSSRVVMLNPGDSLFLWVFPIVGSAEIDGKVMEVCNEPQWVDFRTKKLGESYSEQVFNPSPVRNEDKTPAQKLMIPTVRVAASTVNTEFRVPIKNMQNVVLAWDSLRVIGTNDQTMYGSKTLEKWVEEYNTTYNAWINDAGNPRTHAYPAPGTFSMRYYADKVYQSTNTVKVFLSDGVTPNDDYHSDTKDGGAWQPYKVNDYITFRPIDQAHVDYLVDRHNRTAAAYAAGQKSPYSDTDANWDEKEDTEHTGPQPGFQFVNKVNGSQTPEMHANYTYHMMTNLVTVGFAGEVGGTNSDGCNYATTYFDVIVVPELLIWRPTTSNEWGNDANWHGIVNGVEMDWGFAPLATSSVIIPKLDNELLYPDITGENLYPMSSAYTPYACDNIYMEAGAHILGLEKLRYNKAYVDMPVAHSEWRAMSSPLRKMYSGDFFVPQNTSDWSGATLEHQPYEVDQYGAVNDLLGSHDGVAADNGTLFDPSSFRGSRDNNNPYAFWINYYNKEVKMYHNNTSEAETTTLTASATFAASNALDELIVAGQGVSVLGYGPWDEDPSLVIPLRLPKTDTEYKYFQYGQQTQYGTSVPRDEDFNKFAWKSDVGQPDSMTIRLTNGAAGRQFLMGNPTMAYVDLVQFMADNTGDGKPLTGTFKYMNNGAWVGVSYQTLHISGHRFLAPMEAILVETKADATSIDVVFTANQQTLDNMSYQALHAPAQSPQDVSPAPRRAAEKTDMLQLMTITAYDDNMEAVAYLGKKEGSRHAYRQGEDAYFASSGIEDGISNDGDRLTTPMNIYTTSDSATLMVDIRPGISLVPLRFLVHDDYRPERVNIIFNFNSDWSTPCYLIDSVAGTRTFILDGYVMSIELPENHQYRYYIEGPDPYIQDAPEQPDTPTATEKVVVSDEVFDPSVEKVIKDGHVYIRRGTTLYHVTGVRVE